MSVILSVLVAACAPSQPPIHASPVQVHADRVVADAEVEDAAPAPMVWSAAVVGEGRLHSVAATSDLLWAAGREALFLSEDRGRTFAAIPVSTNHLFEGDWESDSRSIRALWAHGNDVYIATDYRVIVGLNRGAEWKALAAPTMDMVQGEAPAPVEDVWGTDDRNLFYVTNPGGLFRSTDGGATWSGPNGSARELYRYAFTNLTGNASGDMYIKDGSGRLLASTDGGSSWSLREPGIAISGFRNIAAGTKGHALALAEFNESIELFRTTDAGKTWRTIPAGSRLSGIAHGANEDWSAVEEQRILRSTDDGRSWTEEPMRPDGPRTASVFERALELRWTAVWRSATEGFVLGTVVVGGPAGSIPREVSVLARGLRADRENHAQIQTASCGVPVPTVRSLSSPRRLFDAHPTGLPHASFFGLASSPHRVALGLRQ